MVGKAARRSGTQSSRGMPRAPRRGTSPRPLQSSALAAGLHGHARCGGRISAAQRPDHPRKPAMQARSVRLVVSPSAFLAPCAILPARARLSRPRARADRPQGRREFRAARHMTNLTALDGRRTACIQRARSRTGRHAARRRPGRICARARWRVQWRRRGGHVDKAEGKGAGSERKRKSHPLQRGRLSI